MGAVSRFSFLWVLAAVGLALTLGLAVIPVPAQVPGQSTGWGWCAICGRDVYLPSHSHATGPGNGTNSRESVPNTYSAIRLRNKTTQVVTYHLCSTYDYAWQTVTLEAGKGYLHWYRPFSRFSIVFTSNGKRYQYGLDGNFVRGRIPSRDESRDYDFVRDGAGYDLKTGSDRPYEMATPTPAPADLAREAQLLEQRVKEAEEKLQASLRFQQRSDAQRDINKALSEAEASFEMRDFGKAVTGFKYARALARSYLDLNPAFDDAHCQKRIAETLAMQAREAMLQEKLDAAVAFFEQAIATTTDKELRSKWQNELNTARARLADEQSFVQATKAGNEAMERGEFSAAVRHFEAALARHFNPSVKALLATAQNRVREQLAADLRARLAAAAADCGARIPPPKLPASVMPQVDARAEPPAAVRPSNSLADFLKQIVPDLAEQQRREAAPIGAATNARGLDLDWSEFLGPEPEGSGVTLRDPRPLDDPALSALLAGQLPSKREGERLERAASLRQERLRAPDPTTLFIVGEPRARQRVNEYYVALLDEATRQASSEFAQEMRHLEETGLLPRDAPFLKKLESDPALSAAVKEAGKRIIERYLERQRNARCEVEQLLHEVAVGRGTDPLVAKSIAKVQTRLAWEVSQRLQDARRRADQDTIATLQRLTQAGLVRAGASLREQAEQDPVAQQALVRYIAPIEARCLAEQEAIQRDHERRLDEEIAAIKAASSSGARE